MRFMSMVKSAENQGPPPRALMEAMMRGGPRAAAVKMVENGGLAPSAMGVRVRVSDGTLTVTDGPFAEAKELVGGYAILECDTKQQAVDAARWLMQLHVEHWPGWEGETEVRQIFGPPAAPAAPAV